VYVGVEKKAPYITNKQTISIPKVGGGAQPSLPEVGVRTPKAGYFQLLGAPEVGVGVCTNSRISVGRLNLLS